MKLSSCSHDEYQKAKFFQYRDNYNLQGQSAEYGDLNDACVKLVAFNNHSKGTRRQKVSAPNKQCSKKSNLAHIGNGKKELAIFLERKNIEQLVVVCKDSKLKKDAISNKTFPNPKPKDPHQLDLDVLDFQQQHMINRDVESNSLFTEDQPLLNGSRRIMNDKQYMSCDLMDETASNSSVICSPQKLNTLDTFWFSSGSELPTLENVHEDEIPTNELVQNEEPVFSWKESPNPVKTDIVRPLTNSTCSTHDVELTPPSSAVSGSVASDDSITQDFSFLEELSHATVVEDKRPKWQNSICQSLEVTFVPVEPSLRQLRDLYRRKKKSKANKFHRRNHFRERHLRPRNSLRQFTPFMIDPGLWRRQDKSSLKGYGILKRNKLHLNNREQIVKNKARKLAFCQTQLFESAKKDKLKVELRQKKKASKVRSQFENALSSINNRLFRQNQFWKMLPG